MICAAGDWVQAAGEIAEEKFMGKAFWIHARKGALGHVLEVREDGGLEVFFERTGTSTVCGPDEVVRLCDHSGTVAQRNPSAET